MGGADTEEVASPVELRPARRDAHRSVFLSPPSPIFEASIPQISILLGGEKRYFAARLDPNNLAFEARMLMEVFGWLPDARLAVPVSQLAECILSGLCWFLRPVVSACGG